MAVLSIGAPVRGTSQDVKICGAASRTVVIAQPRQPSGRGILAAGCGRTGQPSVNPIWREALRRWRPASNLPASTVTWQPEACATPVLGEIFTIEFGFNE